MKQIIRLLNVIVFVSALFTVILLSYQGMVQQQYPQILKVAISIMDYSFMVAVAFHLYYYKKNKVLMGFSIFNLLIILIAYLIIILNGSCSVWAYLLWDYYLLIYFGTMVIKQSCRRE